MPGVDGWPRKLPPFVAKGFWASLTAAADANKWRPAFPASQSKDRPVAEVINALNAWRDAVLVNCPDEETRTRLDEDNAPIPPYAMKDGSEPPPLGTLLKCSTLDDTTDLFHCWFEEWIVPANEELKRNARKDKEDLRLVAKIIKMEAACSRPESSSSAYKRPRDDSTPGTLAEAEVVERQNQDGAGDAASSLAERYRDNNPDEAMLYEARVQEAHGEADSLEMDTYADPRDDSNPVLENEANIARAQIKRILRDYHIRTKCSRVELLKELVTDLEGQQLLSADDVEEEPTPASLWRSLSPDPESEKRAEFAVAVVSRMRTNAGLAPI